MGKDDRFHGLGMAKMLTPLVQEHRGIHARKASVGVENSDGDLVS